MKSWTTQKGCKIYQVLSGRSNSYLISAGNHSVLVDTGKSSAFTQLNKNINSLKLSCRDIEFLMLTHTHFDHCQSAKRIKEQFNCQIIISDKAAGSVKNGYTVLPSGTNFFSGLISGSGRRIGKTKFGYEPFEPDVLVEGEYKLHVNDTDIKIIETGGHSPDSLSIIVDNEIALAGDAMFGIFRNSVFPPFADNIDDMLKSWGKLLNSGCNTFLPGHGSEVKRPLLQKEYERFARKRNLI